MLSEICISFVFWPFRCSETNSKLNINIVLPYKSCLIKLLWPPCQHQFPIYTFNRHAATLSFVWNPDESAESEPKKKSYRL